MGNETQPDYASPPAPDDAERQVGLLASSEEWGSFFAASLEGFVDTIFTHEAIAAIEDQVRGTEQMGEMGSLIRHWKGSLAIRLEKVIEHELGYVLEDLQKLKPT